ncbi:MAG: cupin domain-containing protein [Candidatus Omnitrophota bacterium]
MGPKLFISAEARGWIDRLGLVAHPEGGYYRETYRCLRTAGAEGLSEGFSGARSLGTAIYYLLNGGEFSAWHRMTSDEIWHFYAGSSLLLYRIDAAGNLTESLLGGAGHLLEQPQILVSAGTWMAARCSAQDSYTLTGATVTPGFDFADFEMPVRENLLRRYPQHRAAIESLTREPSRTSRT